MKDTAERISGRRFLAPKIRERFRFIELVLRRKPKSALDEWKKYVAAVKEN